MDKPRTLLEAVKFFSDRDNCREYLVARRWPNGVTCPTCGSDKVYFDKTRQGWTCTTKHPLRKFSLKTGTIFEDSPLGLDKWLPTVWMLTNCKNGISSYEVHRAIGVTQKTAWFMLQRIRLAMQDDDGGTIDGDVEVDETYIGGKARNMHHKKRKAKITARGPLGKAAVQGLLARNTERSHSTVRLSVVPDTKQRTLQGTIRANVLPGGNVYTDALPSYDGLSNDYVHQVIDHAEKYVDGQVHTNGLENFWSLLKRALKGTYVSVEPFHLFRYLDEQAFRFNQRTGKDADRFSAVICGIVGRRLTYKDLIAALESRATA